MVPSFCQERTIVLFWGRFSAQVVTSSGSWRTAPLIFFIADIPIFGCSNVQNNYFADREPAFYVSFFRSGTFFPLPQDQVKANIGLTARALAQNLVFRIFPPWGLSETRSLEKILEASDHSARTYWLW
jgi:hypothetical protein